MLNTRLYLQIFWLKYVTANILILPCNSKVSTKMLFKTLNTALSYVNMNSQNTSICTPSYSVQHVSKMKLHGKYCTPYSLKNNTSIEIGTLKHDEKIR